MKKEFNWCINQMRQQFFWKKLKKYLPVNPTIIEGGAHNGGDTIKMAKLWPQSTIYAFEPVPELFASLVSNTKLYSNVKVFNKALSNKVGYQELFISSGRSDASSSLLIPKKHLEIHPDVVFSDKILVESISLDEFLYQEKIKEVHFLWLDIQGMEIHVLKEARNTLNNMIAILLEVNHLENYKGCHLFEYSIKWLEKRGFYVVWKGKQYEDAGNVLFLKKT